MLFNIKYMLYRLFIIIIRFTSLGQIINLLSFCPQEVKKQLLSYTDNWVENIVSIKRTENKIFTDYEFNIAPKAFL